jgi:iron(III) transport system substrate-binding protein
MRETGWGRRAGRWTVLLLALWLAAGLATSCSAEHHPPRQVVVYCSVDQNIAEPIFAEFQRRTGIEVLPRFDDEGSKTAALAERLRSEAGVPFADVYWSNEIFHTILLAREGLFQPYVDSPAEANSIPPRYRDAQGLWYGFALRGRAIAYSTVRVPKAEIPRGLEDLLRPQWKGRIAMAWPQFGTTGGEVASWYLHYGRSRFHEIVTQLKANEVKMVGGNSNAVRLVVNGLADAALTDTDDIYAEQQKGSPVALAYMDQNGKGSLAIPNTAAMVQGAPHREEAKALMAFLLSEHVEELLAKSEAHNMPVRASLATGFQQYAIPHPLDLSYEAIADQLPFATQAAAGILKD